MSVHDLQADRDSSGISSSIIYSTFKISSETQSERFFFLTAATLSASPTPRPTAGPLYNVLLFKYVSPLYAVLFLGAVIAQTITVKRCDVLYVSEV